MSNNLFSITNALNKEDKKTITRDRKDKDKILSPYSQNNTQKKTVPVEHSEEVFDAPKKPVNNAPNNVNPYYTSTSGNFSLDNQISGASQVYKLKKAYEDNKSKNPDFDNSSYAKYLTQEADRIRSLHNLPSDTFGSGVTSQDVLDKINYILDSPEYQMSKSNTDYKNLLKKYDDERKALLTTEDKKRAVLSFLDAQKQASDIIKPQAEQAINDTIKAQDTAAIRRGMYGQTPASVLSANAIANTQNQINGQINSLALDLIDKDNARATEEYNIARQNKLDKLSAIEQAILSAEKARQVDNEYNMFRKEDDIRKEENEYRDKVFDRGVVESDRAYEQSEEQFDWTKETDERDYNRGVYEDDRNFNRGGVESDRAYEQSEEQFDWQKSTDERNFNRSVFESDREHEFNEEQFDYKKDTDNREYNLALAKASRGGNSSGGVKTVGNAGISKEGADYIDNVLLGRINSVAKSTYNDANLPIDGNILLGKNGNYAVNAERIKNKYAYADVIANEIFDSNLSGIDKLALFESLKLPQEIIDRYDPDKQEKNKK